MTFIPRFVNSSTQYTCTLTPGVLTQNFSLSPTVNYDYSSVILYDIASDSTGDGVGASDMGAEGHVVLDSSGTFITCSRSIDNHGTNITFRMHVVEFRPALFKQPFRSGGTGSHAFVLPNGKIVPGATGVLPVTYQTGWQYTVLDPK